MCGIVGYTGRLDAVPILLEGLKRLEYRGYDSAGIAVLRGGGLSVRRVQGKIARLEDALTKGNGGIDGPTGIAHTRWATHGVPSERNAHPQLDLSGDVAVVHNGIIENYDSIKRWLAKEGHTFRSETDTEVLAHLIGHFYDEGCPLETAVQKALREVRGTYGIAVVSSREPGKIVGARNGSPLVVGVGQGENFVASDVCAILRHTRQVVYLEDQEMAVLTPEGFRTTTIENESVDKEIEEIAWDLEMAEKGGFEHFMLKEIFEQPRSLENAMRGRLIEETGEARLGGLNIPDEKLRGLRRIIITACGTSWHAGLIGEYMIEEFARIPVEVEYASEFRYRSPILEPDTLVVVISQSGETADTLAAMREAKRKGAKALGICNVVGSTIAREADGGIYIHAGPEIGVASTKAFTSQITVLAILTLLLARQRAMSQAEGQAMVRALRRIPGQVEEILAKADEVKRIAKAYKNHSNFLYLGRGYNFPIALEGALKLKEISYIHAEGYPAAEMKHGPIALIDKNMPVVFIATRDAAYEKILGNLQEVKARKGTIVAVATEGDTFLAEKADHIVTIPRTIDALAPILAVIPLQLLAYYIAAERGCDVDQPRNLAKSVTVE
jgi:glucosamine--fructose-6-phosphate aminotransferase (isomerizing)